MFSRQLARRFGIVSAIIITLMIATTPPQAQTKEKIVDTAVKPHIVIPIKPFLFYQKTPPPTATTKTVPQPIEEPPLGPQWIDNKYTIVARDTLSALIPHLGYSVNELATCSGISNPHKIKPGQILYKPGACVAPPAPTLQAPEVVPQPASGSAEAAISFAMAQLGDPYVWGGDGPNSWDCSGLVHAAFNHAGISISRSTRTLINEGSPVGRDSMMRGDLVFPDDGHVGIYLGNNQFIHAPQSGDVVKISSVYSFYGARRLA